MTSSNDSTPAAPGPSIGTAPAGGGPIRSRWRVSSALFAVRLAVGRILWWFILPVHIGALFRPDHPQLRVDRQDELRIVDYFLSRQPSDGGPRPE